MEKDYKMKTVLMSEKIEELFITEKKGEVYRQIINRTEKILIEKALEYSLGNQIIAANFLGINRNTLRSKIRKLNIDNKRFRS